MDPALVSQTKMPAAGAGILGIAGREGPEVCSLEQSSGSAHLTGLLIRCAEQGSRSETDQRNWTFSIS